MRGGRRMQEDLRSRLTIGFRFANVKMQPCYWPRMDPRIRNLPSTTFGGERLSRRAIAELQETVRFFPELSRTELVRTVCVQMDWHTPGGATRLGFGLRVLGELERRGIVRLPPKRGPGRGPQKPQPLDRRTAPQPPLREPLAQLAPVRLETATEPAEAALWNQWVERYHPLGHKPLPGAQLRYFVHADDGLLLALPGFGAAAWKTDPRDQFIGWDPATRQRNLPLVVNHARYLILPWVRLPCLASHLLACSQRQLPEHWQQRYSIRPVLLETFCETPRFQGTCLPPTGSTSARLKAAASSTLITSTPSQSRTSSSNPSAPTGKPFSIDSSPAIHPAPLERLRRQPRPRGLRARLSH